MIPIAQPPPPRVDRQTDRQTYWEREERTTAARFTVKGAQIMDWTLTWMRRLDMDNTISLLGARCRAECESDSAVVNVHCAPRRTVCINARDVLGFCTVIPL
jgi:hypothetical protein